MFCIFKHSLKIVRENAGWPFRTTRCPPQKIRSHDYGQSLGDLWHDCDVMPAARIFLRLIADFVVYLGLLIRRRKVIAAENLFLRRQLALYQERKVDPRRIDPATRITLALLSKLFNWRDAFVVVQPKTLIRWHRAGFRLLWHWKSKPGRPPIPAELRRLIREMSRDNLLWGEERIANELLVKLGIRVSPRTVRKYMRRKPGRGPRGDQRWRTFLRNHAAAIVACDFCVAVTASFRVLYIFVIIEHASRRLLHWNVTSNPTAAWTLQQLREAIASDHPYRFLVHDRDSIYTQALDTSITNLRLRVLKTPHRSPKANSLCERLIGSLRRECLDWAIPLSEGHLRSLLKMLEHLLQPRTAPYGVRARRARSANRCAGAAAASSASPQREPSGGGQACIERAAP